jgi:hypothetical protein
VRRRRGGHRPVLGRFPAVHPLRSSFYGENRRDCRRPGEAGEVGQFKLQAKRGDNVNPRRTPSLNKPRHGCAHALQRSSFGPPFPARSSARIHPSRFAASVSLLVAQAREQGTP